MGTSDRLIKLNDAAHEITDYIVGYYNALRPHENNGGISPNESENRYWKNSKAVASFFDHFIQSQMLCLSKVKELKNSKSIINSVTFLHIPKIYVADHNIYPLAPY